MKSKNYMLVGLTGPSGSGKTTVTELFEKKDFAIVNADEAAHKALLEPDLIEALSEAFGKDILNPDGSVNRRETAKAAFSSKENTDTLNAITHPVILRLAEAQFEKLSAEGYRKIIFDAPTLFESGSHKLCDKIIAVTAPEEIRLKRIIARDKITEAEAKARIGAQKDSDYYSEKSHYTIENPGDLAYLEEAVEKIAKELSDE